MPGSGDVTWNISWCNNVLSPFVWGRSLILNCWTWTSFVWTFGLVMGRFLMTRAMMVQWLMCGPVESSSLFWWLDFSHLMKRIWTPSTARCDIFSTWVAFYIKISSSSLANIAGHSTVYLYDKWANFRREAYSHSDDILIPEAYGPLRPLRGNLFCKTLLFHERLHLFRQIWTRCAC